MSVDHYENFPVASWLCPAQLRPAIRAIYHYARTADDLADEGTASAAQRQADLAAYREDLQRVFQGLPASPRWRPVFDALAQAISTYRLPMPLLDDLLCAFEQDTRQPHYADRTQLLDYCRRSANPIGRLLLHLYAVDDAAALRQSDAVCTALQLINFWQDLSVDLPRGRLYVPLADAARHGLDAPMLLAAPDSPAARRLVAELVDWSADLMHSGAPLALRLPGRVGWELRLVVQGGLRIVERLRRPGHRPMRERPTVGALDAPRLLWRAWRMRSPMATVVREAA